MTTERTALITGASSGFGLLTSVTLARRGWRVLATMRDLGRRERLETAARNAGVLDRVGFHTLDVTNAEQIDALATVVANRTGPLNALINNAGFAMAGFADEITDAELRLQFETNFFGATAVKRAFLPQFRRQRSGHIVMVSSVSGLISFPGVGSYAASKFALEGWTETLRFELKSQGIQVALVEPGPFETDIWTRNATIAARMLEVGSPDAARTAKWRARIETGKPKGNPQIVADAIANIVQNPRPRLRTVLGKAAKIGLFMRRILPSALFESILLKNSGVDG
jgi:NAD(P)-dependent dehydrogenase (short-subunit alcohol dehydrogenase family)